jgi:hypothetical protein
VKPRVMPRVMKREIQCNQSMRVSTSNPALKAGAASRRAMWTVAVFMLLSACASRQQVEWLPDLPDRAFFEAAYSEDSVNQTLQTREEYLGWIKSFYTGTLLYPTGWFDVQERVLSTSSPENVDAFGPRIEEMGRLIAAEWAKENSARAIDNRLLALWGATLQSATPGNQRLEVFDLVASDVRRLLSRELDKAAIADSRYDELLGLDSFGDF